jgi:hypothetical protein
MTTGKKAKRSETNVKFNASFVRQASASPLNAKAGRVDGRVLVLILWPFEWVLMSALLRHRRLQLGA